MKWSFAKRLLAGVGLAAILAAPAVAQEAVDEAAIAKIKTEGLQHSQVMDTLSWLSDVYGPRLYASSNLRKAAEWARNRMAAWGLQNAALEPVAHTARGWSLERFSIEMTEPQYQRITGYPRAWSPALNVPLVGTPILVSVRNKSDFARYRGKLKGAIVMNGRPEPGEIAFVPQATRMTDAELAKQAEQLDPAAPGFDAPASLAEEDDAFDAHLEREAEVLRFFAAEGVAALVTPSSIPEDVRVDGFYDQVWRPTFPGFVIAREHYGRIVRMLDRQQPMKLSLSLSVKFDEAVPAFNVVAEIPGADPVLKSEVVMLGAHLDSWHTGTGATDNGAGSAAVMEAVRILKAIGAKPRRTIRVALWTGEEEDYYGSRGYVDKHFASATTLALKPEHARLAAYFNLDNGSGRIRGVNLQGNEAVRPIFEEWLKPFNYLGAATLTALNTGGTDHMPFDAVGLPAFQFLQDPLNYDTRVHHSNLDVYEETVPDDLKQASVIVAAFVYNAAMRDAMLPRKPLLKPTS